MADISVLIDTDGATGDYSSLNLAEAGEQATYSDLVGDNNTMTFNCQASTGVADTTQVDILGWTTSSDYDITIIGEIADDGIWGDTIYRLAADPGGNQGVLAVGEDYVTLQSLQITHTGDSNTSWVVAFSGQNSNNSELIDSCNLKGHSDSSGIYCFDSDANITVKNTIITGGGTSGYSEGCHMVPCNTLDLINCVIYGCNDGIENDGGTVTAKNCLVFNCGDDFDGTVAATYCASDDSQAGTGNFQITQTASDYAALITDAPNGDFSITDTDSELYDAGDGNTGTDITGYTWVTDDIGAFAWQAAGGGTLLPKKVNAGLINNSLTRPRLVA